MELLYFNISLKVGIKSFYVELYSEIILLGDVAFDS